MKRWRIGLSAVLAIGALACTERPVEKTLWVGAERVPCGAIGPPDCLRVSEDPAAGWTLLRGEIKGFTWQEGHAYELRVQQPRTAAPAAVLEGAQLELVEIIRETKEEPGSKASRPGSNPISSKLVDRTWFLVTDDPVAAEDAPEGARRTWIRFHADRLTGLAGCNRYFGRYELGADRITIGDVASTSRACEAAIMEQERAHLDALQAAQAIEVTDEGMQLVTADGRVLRFEERAPEPRTSAHAADATPAPALSP